MITVHVLTMPGDRRDWRRAVRRDLHHPAIVQHWRRGVELDTGTARARAFREAQTPFVGFADPDDRTKTAAWLHCLAYLQAHPDVVLASTGQAVVSEDMRRIERVDVSRYDRDEHLRRAQHVHGVMVMRTDAVRAECDRMEGLLNCSEWALSLALTRHGRIVKLPFVGRYWRQHSRQNHLRCTDLQKDRARRRAFE